LPGTALIETAPYIEKLKNCFHGEKQVIDLYNNFKRR
jgi:hypothetical protein